MKYEAGLHSKKKIYAGDGLDKPDNTYVYDAHVGASPVCGASAAEGYNVDPVCIWREHLQRQMGKRRLF